MEQSSRRTNPKLRFSPAATPKKEPQRSGRRIAPRRIPKTWRSELPLIIFFWFSLVACVPLSRILSWTIIRGEILPIFNYSLMLELPLLWLIPAGILSTILFRIYNVRYELTRDGIEWTVGILWTSQMVSKMTFSDVLTVETKQTLLGRMLDIGNVEIGSAQTDDVEIIFAGVGSPRKIQRLIELGRDMADEADL